MAGNGAEAAAWTPDPPDVSALLAGRDDATRRTRDDSRRTRSRAVVRPDLRIPRLPAGLLGPDAVQRFVDTVRHQPARDALQSVEALVEQGVSVDRIYTELVAPAARELGRLWEDDRCDYFHVTLATGVMQRLVSTLGERKAADEGDGVQLSRPRRTVFLSAPEREQHTLGLIMVAACFHRAGWSVTMGAPFEPEARLRPLRSRHFDLVGFSISRDDSLPSLGDIVARTRGASLNHDVPVMLGGRAIEHFPGCVPEFGGDGTAKDGPGALAVARALL